MKIGKCAGLALASLMWLGLLPGAASAVTVNFGLPGSLSLLPGASSGTFSAGSGLITGSVYADGGCTFCNAVITQHASEGLGVSTHFLDDPALDGAPLWQSLTFAFDKTVKVLSIQFGWMDNEDDWSIEVNGSTLTGNTPSVSFTNLVTSSLSVLAKDAFEQTGCSWAIGGHCIIKTGGPDDFSVKSIDVALVPLPAALPLFGTALGGLGLAGWLRKRKPAATT